MNFNLARDFGERLRKIWQSLTLKDPFVIGVCFFAFFVDILSSFVLWFFVPNASSPIPLHYNIYFGVDYIDFGYKAYAIPMFGVFVLVVNFLFIYLFYLKEKLLSYFLTSGILLVHLGLIWATYIVIFLNPRV
jgi:hypothetical protein